MTPKPSPEEPKKPYKLRSVKLSTKLLPWIVVLALVLFSAFMYVQYKEAKDKINSNTPASTNKQVENVVAKVGKLIILPKDQEPSIVTVIHAENLKKQSFFANAKDGDKVLVYKKQKQAILYRPSTNQLVNVAAVTVSPTGNTNVAPQ